MQQQAGSQTRPFLFDITATKNINNGDNNKQQPATANMTATTKPLTPGTSQVQADNTRLRITRWHLPPQSETGHHRHEYDYAIVPITAGTLTITEGGNQKQSPLTPGTSYHRPAGVEHNVQNLTNNDIIFVEVEIK